MRLQNRRTGKPTIATEKNKPNWKPEIETGKQSNDGENTTPTSISPKASKSFAKCVLTVIRPPANQSHNRPRW